MIKNKKIHKDKNGREFIKEVYFVRGKMKHHKVYVVNGISAEEFYAQNASDLEFYQNGDYHLIRGEEQGYNKNVLPDDSELDPKDDLEDLPF